MTANKNLEEYFPISPLMMFPQASGDFEVHLKQETGYVLYTVAGESFTPEHRQNLFDHGVEEVYIPGSQRQAYDEYVETNLGEILLEEKLPLEIRSKAFYDSSVKVVGDAFETKMPVHPSDIHYQRVLKLVEFAVEFLSREDSLRGVAKLISHNYGIYTHCLHVLIYTTAVLEAFDVDEETIIQCGLGAILHDIGKTRIPKEILEKRGELDPEEWEIIKRHPNLGLAACAQLPLSPVAIHCILFHHEKLDGSGYPAALTSDDIPFAAKVVSLANTYDSLTTERPYAQALAPFEALSIIKEQIPNRYDQEIYKRLVLVLSFAGVVDKI
ncbi:MAG: HD domain-containing phosphohydrolase [Desulfarculaceae bacterium]|jgi:putative nucleotidyltransferase with HDIG domain